MRGIAMKDALIAAAIIKNFIQKNKIKNFVLFDIGSNIGKYSKTVLENLAEKKEKVSLLLVEPNDNLNHHLENIENKKEVYNCAIDNCIGYATLHIVEESISKSSLVNRPAFKHLNFNKPKEIKVKTNTLKNVLENSEIFKNMSKNSGYLKIDVEGYEKEAIDSLDKLHFDYFFGGQFEYGGCWQERNIFARDTIKKLSAHYDIFIEDSKSLGIILIDPENFVENYSHTNIFFFKKEVLESLK